MFILNNFFLPKNVAVVFVLKKMYPHRLWEKNLHRADRVVQLFSYRLVG